MNQETICIAISMDGDYGVKVDAIMRVHFEYTPAYTAPRFKYGQPEHPDSPEQVEIDEVSIRLGLGDGFHKVTTFDHPSIELAVQEELAARRERNKEDAL